MVDTTQTGAMFLILGILSRVAGVGLLIVGGFGLLVIVFGSRNLSLDATHSAAMAIGGLLYAVVGGGSGWGLWFVGSKLIRRSKKHR